jgi:hypothetical protein
VLVVGVYVPRQLHLVILSRPSLLAYLIIKQMLKDLCVRWSSDLVKKLVPPILSSDGTEQRGYDSHLAC